ncbi:NUDIX domain-containing protein [Jeotgalibacillus terrae]|uniref:NUDIX domain-containing protein n=1 Tax=Jeotgalibacillus terrae TaxID=587735 RepID=A0ABW5ZGP8_9BACL|nr:NUDIX domain-containing protein [Jeotgalibacillus terrae]MBM7579418.1 ADP-ribose pyrophosphatase YjhB (NUDIX family) [Jeotgalibacillus terrae]
MRHSTKALIIKDHSVLLTKNEDQQGAFYIFPGGGQEDGETMHEACIRECMEETGLTVKPGELLYVREYIGKNHEYAAFDSHVHQIESYFQCSVSGEAKEPVLLDANQTGVEWLPIKELHQYRIYPKALIRVIQETDKTAVYLGDVN